MLSNGQRTCFQFAESGTCRFGERCKFDHIVISHSSRGQVRSVNYFWWLRRIMRQLDRGDPIVADNEGLSAEAQRPTWRSSLHNTPHFATIHMGH